VNRMLYIIRYLLYILFLLDSRLVILYNSVLQGGPRIGIPNQRLRGGGVSILHLTGSVQ